MTPGESWDYPLDADLLHAAGRLGHDFAWRLSDGRNVVNRLAASHRAIISGELWVLWEEGPLCDIPRLSQNAPIYAAVPLLNPHTGEYDQPGLYVWESQHSWKSEESWDEYCDLTAHEALAHLERIEALRTETAPEVRDKLWVHLDSVTHSVDVSTISADVSTFPADVSTISADIHAEFSEFHHDDFRRVTHRHGSAAVAPIHYGSWPWPL